MVSGAVQALVAAALISLTNVVTSTAGGYFIGRYLSYGIHAADSDNPIFKKKRDAAWTCLFGFVTVMAYFHLTVGLVRAQEVLHNIEHSVSRYAEILTTPEALFLVMVGVVTTILSWIKGMTAFGDPYPGFGDKQRSVNQVQDQLPDRYEDFSNQITARFDERREALDEDEKAAIKKVATNNQAVADCHKSIRTLDRYIKEADSQLQTS